MQRDVRAQAIPAAHMAHAHQLAQARRAPKADWCELSSSPSRRKRFAYRPSVDAAEGCPICTAAPTLETLRLNDHEPQARAQLVERVRA